jgi:hypothetical protein
MPTRKRSRSLKRSWLNSGCPGVVGLFAEIANRRAEVLLLAGEDLKAAVWTHDAKALDRAARTLDGD